MDLQNIPEDLSQRMLNAQLAHNHAFWRLCFDSWNVGIHWQKTATSEMELTEIKEFYAEELSLLKRIQDYGRGQAKENSERIERVTLLLLYRIFSNLYSASLLTASALKRRKISFFQLPIGIVLRCTFTDCIFALYLQRLNKQQALEELDLRTIEYANSLLERREVYRDQVKSTGMGFDDSFIDDLWESTLEDNFMHLLTFDDSKKDLEITKRSKPQLQEVGFLKSKSAGIKEQKDFLIKQGDLDSLTTRLFHYYKYFSQYEHFSENGQGDVLVSANDEGNDNVHLPSAIQALSEAVEKIIDWRERNSRSQQESI